MKTLSKYVPTKKMIIFILIAAAAIISRFVILGQRVMSHDEINHVYFAYGFFKGGDYIHNPLTHGPLQFHLLEFSYFLFDVSDFSARLPAAIFSIVTVLFIWKFRGHLGRNGAIAASVLFLISPFMLYYGRYARNEAIAIFFTIATTWAVLKYLDSGENKYLYITAALTAFHFTTKETAFIFTAEVMIFLGLLFIYRMTKRIWKIQGFQRIFLLLLMLTAICLVAAVIVSIPPPAPDTIEVQPEPVEPETSPLFLPLVLSAGGLFLLSVIILVIGYGWNQLGEERSFAMLLLQLTLVMPQLAAFPAFWLKLPMTEYQNNEVVGQVSRILAIFLVLSILLGGLWKPKVWLISAGIYYGIFLLFYTSIFSNMGGVYSGMIGSLGYWLEQHGVERGSQPWYYFLLVQLPLYEYLAIIGTTIGSFIGLTWLFRRSEDPLVENTETGQLSQSNSQKLTVLMLIFISFISLLAYMMVGEKMPWLTAHIAWSMLLLTGWLIGTLIDRVDWKALATKNLVITILSTSAIILIIPRIARLVISDNPPFAGKELTQIARTSEFLLIVLLGLVAIYLLFKFTWGWKAPTASSIILLTLFGVLGILTARHAGLASYKNYDLANEYLVYAHSARGPKDALEQIESISLRQTGGKDIKIAMDNHTPYPFWWYLRDYPNRFEYREEPTRDLRNYPIILAGDGNYHLIEPIVQDDYIAFEYPRMVWPNQDYFNLSFYSGYLGSPETRAPMLNALADIWLNRDFTKYGEVTGQDVSPVNWNPSQSFKMYIRKDIATQVWQFGALATSFEVAADPYLESKLDLTPTFVFNNLGLNGPKGIAVAPDGSLYVADTGNNRIVHVSLDGDLLNAWGTEGSGQGEFNQPWGLTVDQNGQVYVADTWNHRIQKFSPDGEFLAAWGEYGQELGSAQFWGPRDVVLNSEGQLMVSDTGNKRLHTFSTEGEFIDAFGSAGYQPAEFDEPVGLAISPTTRQLFVADTWNQRVQVFSYGDEIGFVPVFSWDMDAWYGQSLDNKPFLDVDLLDRVYVADPEAARVIVFGIDGTFLSTFGDYEPTGLNGFGLIGGLAADNAGGVWVTDSLTNQIKYFIVP